MVLASTEGLDVGHLSAVLRKNGYRIEQGSLANGLPEHYWLLTREETTDRCPPATA